MYADDTIPWGDVTRLPREARTLHATSLVHEAHIKLAAGRGVEALDRAHFLALAAGGPDSRLGGL